MNEWMMVPVVFLAWGVVKILREDAVFVPLPYGTVKKMFDLAEVKKGETIYDLGSGDGRLLLEAERRGANAIGIEKWWLMALLSKFRARDKDNVRIVKGDIFKEKIEGADVVFMYLSPRVTNELKEKLERELKKGARVVSAAHKMNGWEEEKRIKTGHFWTYLYVI